MSSPRILQARPRQHAQSQAISKPPNSAQQPRQPKPQAPRLKVIIRRLPPALTEEEFKATLGPDWAVGGGNVDWFIFKPGKVHVDAAKQSRCSRAYLHLVDPSLLARLSKHVKSISFQDAQNTWTTFSHLGTPTLEYSPFGKIPNKTNRVDARQGLIDQDTEFIAFLQSLTDPVAPKASIDVEEAPTKEEKVTITPLIQYLRDMKASKGKDGRGAKGSKHSRTESKEKSTDKQAVSKGGSVPTSGDSKRRTKDAKFEKASKEAVKVLNKEAGKAKAAKAISSPSAEAQPVEPPRATPETPPTGPASIRRRERGNAAAAARILQRDLGLTPNGSPRRHGRGRDPSGAASRDNKASVPNSPLKQNATLSSQAQEPKIETGDPAGVDSVIYPPEDEQFVGVGDIGTEVEAKGPAAETAARDAATRKRRTPAPTPKPGPVPQMILKKPTSSPIPASATPAVPASTNPPAQPSAPVVPPTAPKSDRPKNFPDRFPHVPNQAFLKHANPSQGITEELIKTALEVFGSILKVDIDTKKGFAYVNFENRDGLLAAIKASPVKVAQGQVQVLERNEKKGHAFRKDAGGGTQGGRAKAARGIVKNRGQRGGGQGGGQAGAIVAASGVAGNRGNDTTVAATAATPAADPTPSNTAIDGSQAVANAVAASSGA